MDKWIITYCTDPMSWDTVNTIVAEGDKDEIEDSLHILLRRSGLDSEEAKMVVDDGLYFIRNNLCDVDDEEFDL